MRFSRLCGAACVFLLAAVLTVHAQFTSRYSSVFLEGNFNGYAAQPGQMTLVSNDVWQGYARLTNCINSTFVFSTNSYPSDTNSFVWAQTNQANFSMPLSGVASYLAPTSTTVVITDTNAGVTVTNITVFVPGIVVTSRVSSILRFTFDDRSGAYSVKDATFGSPPSQIWINEFHYDNISTDKNEGVELAGAAGVALTNYQLRLIDSSGKIYNSTNLTGTLPSQLNGLGTVWLAFLTNGLGLRNTQGGMALFQAAPYVFTIDDFNTPYWVMTTNLVQFLSYGGQVTLIVTNVTVTPEVPDSPPYPYPAATNISTNILISTDVGLQEDNGSTPVDYSLQLIGSGSQGSDFFWTGPIPNTRGQINSNQFALAAPAAASVLVTNIAALPYPVVPTNQSMTFQASLTGVNGASNISATLFYRPGITGSFVPLAMTNAGNTYTTSGSVPPQPNNTVIYYYFFMNFDGPGTNNPSVYPPTAPSAPLRARSSTQPYGQFWINEIDPAQSGNNYPPDTGEFVELAGLAGTLISGWTLEMLDQNAATYATYTISNATVLANQLNGFGFFVLGDSAVPGAKIVFTNAVLASLGNGHMADIGALRLYDPYGVIHEALCYGTSLPNFTYIGSDSNQLDQGIDGESSLTGSGSGNNLTNFTWTSSAPTTPGSVNGGEVLVGGSTNAIQPFISCQSDRVMTCLTNLVPSNNPLLVTATGFCGNGSVIVTWTGDKTNSGTGCKGNAKIITRTYQAVSTNCAPWTTNTCSQLFIYEDTNAPVINAPTQTLANAGFENGTLIGWNVFGPVTSQTAYAIEPRSGNFHALLKPAFGFVCHDSSGNLMDGVYTNGVLRAQPPASTSYTYSAFFDGTNDYVDIPPLPPLNESQATFALWLKRSGTQPNFTGMAFSRGAGSDISGFGFIMTNQLGYTWAGTTNSYGWRSGIIPPDGQWTFAALAISPSNSVIYMRTTNGWLAATNRVDTTNLATIAVGNTNSAFTGEIDLGRDAIGSRYYNGAMQDVQIYNRALTKDEVSSLWNNGLGGVVTNGLRARWKLDEYTNNTLVADSSGNGFRGTNVNGVLTGLPPATTAYTNSADFDGANDYMRANGPGLATNTATITTWIRRDGTQTNYAGLVLLRNGADVTGLNFTTNNQLGYCWAGQTNDTGWTNSALVPPDGRWTFVALTVSPTNATLYMLTAYNVTNAPTPFVGRLNIGRDSSGGRQFRGNLNDVQFYYRTLSFAEITNLWNNGVGGSTTNNLYGRWVLDDYFLSGTVNGFYQDLTATNGQKWNAAIWAKMSPANPMQGTNQVSVALQFLNTTNGVISNSVASVVVNSSSQTNSYQSLTARGTAPANSARARILVTYQQDDAGDQGAVELDDAFMSGNIIPASAGVNQCGKMPNFMTNGVVSFFDDCGTVNTSQSPLPNSLVTTVNVPVTITASDSCGNQSQVNFTAYVDDTTVPQAFSLSPASKTVACSSDSFATSYSVYDNCPGWVASRISSATNVAQTNAASFGCAGNPMIITNIYRLTDIGGNIYSPDQVQIVTVMDTNPPIIVSTANPALTNAGFETGVFATNWNVVGNATIMSVAPHGGTKHVKLAGITNGAYNYNGIYQDLDGQFGQTWRLGAWVMTPTNEAISSINYLDMSIDSYDVNYILLDTVSASYFTNGIGPAGLYRQVAVTTVLPTNTAHVRASLYYSQFADAPGAVYVDDVSLSRTTYSAATTNSCGAFIGNLGSLAIVSDCGNVTVTQSPPVGVSLTLGRTNVLLYAVDNCGNTRTTTVSVVVADDVPPVVTAGPSDITVPTTNSVPAPSTNGFSWSDCSSVTITNLPDTNNGGLGTSNSPLIIARTYQLVDAATNITLYSQTITVSGSAPPPPTNVAIAALTLGGGVGFNVLRSTGTNTWNVFAEYTTNLAGQQFWWAVSNASTVWSNGTNITTFTVPTNALPAFIRVKQTYP